MEVVYCECGERIECKFCNDKGKRTSSQQAILSFVELTVKRLTRLETENRVLRRALNIEIRDGCVVKLDGDLYCRGLCDLTDEEKEVMREDGKTN